MNKIIILLLVLLFISPYPGSGQESALYRMGPSGGNGGFYFEDTPILDSYKVSEVRIRAGGYVDMIQIVYRLPNGGVQEMSSHGGSGGAPGAFVLGEGEYITGIKGRYGGFVDSIQIITNLRSSPVYGGSGGSKDYIYEAPAGMEIAGFLGRSGGYVDAIGVLLRQRP